MKKEKVDFIFLVCFLSLLILYSYVTNSNFDIKQSLFTLVPFSILGFLSFYQKTTFKINFLIFLVCFSAVFYNPDAFVDWTGYLFMIIFAAPLALLWAFVLKVRQEKIKQGELDKSFINWLHKKKPTLSVKMLFILGFLLYSLIFCLLFYFLFPTFSIFLFLLCLSVSFYLSFSETYFYIILPKKDS